MGAANTNAEAATAAVRWLPDYLKADGRYGERSPSYRDEPEILDPRFASVSLIKDKLWPVAHDPSTVLPLSDPVKLDSLDKDTDINTIHYLKSAHSQRAVFGKGSKQVLEDRLEDTITVTALSGFEALRLEIRKVSYVVLHRINRAN